MARIYAPTTERTFKITRWQGLNEAPDGDTKLKMGEASACSNWRVTRDSNLQVRPGSRNICGFMPEYSLSVSAAESEAQEKEFSFSLWPVLTVTESGILKTSGDKVTVTHENITNLAAKLAGYYYYSSETQTAKRFVSAPYSAEAGRFVINWETVKVAHSSLNAEVKGLWSGYVGGEECLVVACNDALWKAIYRDLEWSREKIGDLDTTNKVFMFGFSQKLYILNGFVYMVWDGRTFSEVEGYRPIVSIGNAPTGGGTNFEQVNKLTSARRAWFSPDGQSLTFHLPETDIASVDWVIDRATDSNITRSWTADINSGTITFAPEEFVDHFTGDGKTVLFAVPKNIVSLTVSVDETAMTADLDYTYNRTLGEIRFTTAPADGASIRAEMTLAPEEGTNTIEIGWTAYRSFRPQITGMKYAELFSGATDNAVFVYGDGSNKAYFSGVDYDGNPTAEYFPDMNVLNIGDENTPITSLIRHYSRLVAFKTNSAYSIQYGTITLADGSEIAAFYSTPVNRSIGHAAPGQAQLVLNDPITLHGRDVYSWKNNSSYSSNLTVDERQARRISDRIAATFGTFAASECIMFDHNYAQELYIVYNDRALVWNYAADAWYTYTNFPARCMVAYGRDLYYGDGDGYLRHVSSNYRNDNGQPINALWRSGSMSFNAEWLKKYTLRIFLGMKPDAKSAVNISVDSDRETDIGEAEITTATANAATFVNANFRDWSFGTDRMPRITRHKLKAKKYAYLRLVLSSNSAVTTAKLTSADITVRDTVYAR